MNLTLEEQTTAGLLVLTAAVGLGMLWLLFLRPVWKARRPWHEELVREMNREKWSQRWNSDSGPTDAEISQFWKDLAPLLGQLPSKGKEEPATYTTVTKTEETYHLPKVVTGAGAPKRKKKQKPRGPEVARVLAMVDGQNYRYQ